MRLFSFFFVCSTLFLVGCAYPKPDNQPLKLLNLTKKQIDEDFAAETAYRSQAASSRRIGLAMSGGGSKAGMFSHGVLQGLNDTGLLQHIDVISTTSGSNYPVFWYFTKHIEASEPASPEFAFDVQQIFDDCIPAWYGTPSKDDFNDEEKLLVPKLIHQAVKWAEANNYPVCRDASHYFSDEQGVDRLRWQAHLVRWPDLFNTNITEVTGDKQQAPISNTLGLTLRLFSEIPISFLPFDSGIPVSYMQGIERTWGLNPKPRNKNIVDDKNASEQDKWDYSNSTKTFFGANHVSPDKISWEKLQNLYKENPRLPLWVMNTTEGQKTNLPDMNNLYELTPFSSGSPRHTYHFARPPMPTIAHGVRASAAFADAQGATGFLKIIVNLVDNVIPALHWGVKIEQSSPIRNNVRLSDGGAADNLGLISLVRRGLDQIIVVDTAQDVEGRMGDLCWAKKALDDEGYSLSIGALEKLDDVCGGEKALAYNVSEWKNAVLTGNIRPKPNNSHGDAINDIKIFWIKAAWNEYEVNHLVNDINNRSAKGVEYDKTRYLELCGKAGQINCWMPVYYAHNAGETTNGKRCINGRVSRGDQENDCFIDFPQLKTVNSTFNASSYQFWAFRELARSMANQIQIDNKGELSTNIQPCLQKAKTARKGKRPNDWDKDGWLKNEALCVSPPSI